MHPSLHSHVLPCHTLLLCAPIIAFSFMTLSRFVTLCTHHSIHISYLVTLCYSVHPSLHSHVLPCHTLLLCAHIIAFSFLTLSRFVTLCTHHSIHISYLVTLCYSVHPSLHSHVLPCHTLLLCAHIIAFSFLTLSRFVTLCTHHSIHISYLLTLCYSVHPSYHSHFLPCHALLLCAPIIAFTFLTFSHFVTLCTHHSIHISYLVTLCYSVHPS